MVEHTADVEQSPGETRSTGELVKQLSEQVTVLIRDELKLAQLEMTRKGKQAGVGAGLLGGSGLVALYGVGCLIACAVIAISGVVAAWLAALIVGAALMMQVSTPFRLFGYPGLAMLLFLLAAACGFLLILSVFFNDDWRVWRKNR